ncbi:hypothetical protein [Paraglaciecola sp.]|uniref:hypothetical protein n=1 Tax=Paraglaciecola sp. TaxID=1920173 RepID=UPI003262FC10
MLGGLFANGYLLLKPQANIIIVDIFTPQSMIMEYCFAALKKHLLLAMGAIYSGYLPKKSVLLETGT